VLIQIHKGLPTEIQTFEVCYFLGSRVFGGLIKVILCLSVCCQSVCVVVSLSVCLCAYKNSRTIEWIFMKFIK
jgi:hypothetical protein